jgi:hypothetical protein
MRDAEELEARGRRPLRAALTAVLVCDNAPELRLVREWLDNWSGLGLIVPGMTHQGWDVQLTAYASHDWRASFFPVGIRAHHRRWQREGADVVAGGAAGGVGGSGPMRQSAPRWLGVTVAGPVTPLVAVAGAAPPQAGGRRRTAS